MTPLLGMLSANVRFTSLPVCLIFTCGPQLTILSTAGARAEQPTLRKRRLPALRSDASFSKMTYYPSSNAVKTNLLNHQRNPPPYTSRLSFIPPYHNVFTPPFRPDNNATPASFPSSHC